MHRRAQGFDMDVLAFDPPMKDIIEARSDVEYAEFDDLLARSDFVTIHTDLNPSTHHLFDAAVFARMKETAILINTARGPVVDEAALVDALKSGQIGGAGLDVFEHEPAFHPGLADCDNVVMLPHIASGSVATRDPHGHHVRRERGGPPEPAARAELREPGGLRHGGVPAANIPVGECVNPIDARHPGSVGAAPAVGPR